jgi:alpha-beta hydrolase superfamily lysophospholipase
MRRGGSLHIRAARAAGDPLARLAILPGYGDHSGRYFEFMRWMATRGVGSYALDFRGHGRSQGKRGYVRRWDDFLDDLKVFLDNVAREDTHKRPAFLLGHSHGALVAAVAAGRGALPALVEGLVLVSPFVHSLTDVPPMKLTVARVANVLAPWLRLGSGLQADMMTDDPAMVEESKKDPLLLRTATPRWYFGMLDAQAEAKKRARSVTLPVMCLIGSKDTVADPKAAAKFCESLGSFENHFELLEGQRHELLREAKRLGTFVKIFDWIKARAK